MADDESRFSGFGKMQIADEFSGERIVFAMSLHLESSLQFDNGPLFARRRVTAWQFLAGNAYFNEDHAMKV